MWKIYYVYNIHRQKLLNALFILATVTVSFFCCIGTTIAKTRTVGGISIVNADRLEITSEGFTGDGNVEVTWGEYRLYSEHLELKLHSGELTAVGRVNLSSNKTVITGGKFFFNVKNQTGIMEDTYGQLSPSTRYTTGETKVESNNTLKFKKMEFTPCAQCTPRWKISCSNGKIKKEKYVQMKNVLFKVKKIPVFYVPILHYPLDKDGRATGFLFPLMGSSKDKGFFVSNAFFWDIKPYMDLTLNVDYYSKAGIGLAEDFRYITHGMTGNIKFYYMTYREGFQFEQLSLPTVEGSSDDPLNPVTRKPDFLLEMKHIQTLKLLNAPSRFTVHIDKPGDPNFLRVFSNDFDMLQRNTFRSSLSFDTTIYKAKISVEASENETYSVGSNKSRFIRKLPSISLNVNQEKIWKLPGYFSLYASFSNKKRWKKSYENDIDELTTTEELSDDQLEAEEKSVERVTSITFKPSYSLKLSGLPWLKANLNLSSKHKYYLQSLNPLADEATILDSPLYLSSHTAAISLKGPIFARIFESETSKFKHIIEPGITFRYATPLQEDDLERVIPLDSFVKNEYTYLGVSLSTRLLMKSKKGKGSAREILSLSVKQDYYFDPVLGNSNRKITILDRYPEFSQLKNTLRLRPLQHFVIDATLKYNHYWKTITNLILTMGYSNKKSPLRGNFKYVKYINQYRYKDPDVDFGSETIGGSLTLDDAVFPLKLRTRADYDLKYKRFNFSSMGVSFDYQCVTFFGELKLYNLTGQMTPKFQFGISFGNLGMVKDMF
jgi:lipopolysaccharide assembly outer membrane protein LptD (OstA)